MQPGQGQGQPQAATPNGRPLTDGQLEEIPTQQIPAAPKSTTPSPPKAIRKGLLSSWNDQNTQFPQTEEMPASPRPNSGAPGPQPGGYRPTYRPPTEPLNRGSYQSQRSAPAPMSPYQAGSGVYPFSGSQAGTFPPVQQPPTYGQRGPMAR